MTINVLLQCRLSLEPPEYCTHIGHISRCDAAIVAPAVSRAGQPINPSIPIRSDCCSATDRPRPLLATPPSLLFSYHDTNVISHPPILALLDDVLETHKEAEGDVRWTLSDPLPIPQTNLCVQASRPNFKCVQPLLIDVHDRKRYAQASDRLPTDARQ